jgi:cystathionine beta-lyase family protein involved in aluminum resistance
MEEVIGLRGTPGHGALMEWGVTYRELPLAPDGKLDWQGLATAIRPGVTKVAHIQRSCGYALRPTLTVEEIGRAVQVGRFGGWVEGLRQPAAGGGHCVSMCIIPC